MSSSTSEAWGDTADADCMDVRKCNLELLVSPKVFMFELFSVPKTFRAKL